MIGLSIALASRKKYRINFPLVMDDLFFASDFINKKYDQEVEEKHIKDLQEYISPKSVNSSLQQIIDKFNCALS